MAVKGKEIVLGVSGGIACYKAPEIIRGIKDAGGNVSVIMTKSATEFVRPLVFQALSERQVATSLFSLEQESKIGHIKVSENADAFILAPATANIIAKAATGIADDLLSTSLLANQSPLFIAPAMNNRMWEHPSVAENLEKLRNRGASVIGPGTGYLACGTIGPGRMAEPNEIVSQVLTWFEDNEGKETASQPLKGFNVLITAGPTRERIDVARFISNYSSGKMGYAIAEHCRDLGANVCLISGPTKLPPPAGVEVINIESTEEMYQAVFSRAPQSQLIIKAAAVSDYRAEVPESRKIKKTGSMNLPLVKTTDILAELGKQKTENQYLVGFAAESDNIEEYARKKVLAKHLDIVIANDITRSDAGFDVDTNQVFIIDQISKITLPLLSKKAVAVKIIEHIISSDRWQRISQKTT